MNLMEQQLVNLISSTISTYFLNIRLFLPIISYINSPFHQQIIKLQFKYEINYLIANIFYEKQKYIIYLYQIQNPNSNMVYYTPDGDQISTLRSRILAVGVALLFTYALNFICQGLITFILKKQQTQRKKVLTKLLETSRILYLYAVAVIFSSYPPFYQGTHSAVLAWITFLIVLLMHIFCFVDKKIKDRSLWAYMYFLYHLLLVIWLLLAMGFAYNWASKQ